MIGKFPEVLNFDPLFLKLDRFICNLWSVLLVHRSQVLCPPIFLFGALAHAQLAKKYSGKPFKHGDYI